MNWALKRLERRGIPVCHSTWFYIHSSTHRWPLDRLASSLIQRNMCKHRVIAALVYCTHKDLNEQHLNNWLICLMFFITCWYGCAIFFLFFFSLSLLSFVCINKAYIYTFVITLTKNVGFFFFLFIFFFFLNKLWTSQAGTKYVCFIFKKVINKIY